MINKYGSLFDCNSNCHASISLHSTAFRTQPNYQSQYKHKRKYTASHILQGMKEDDNRWDYDEKQINIDPPLQEGNRMRKNKKRLINIVNDDYIPPSALESTTNFLLQPIPIFSYQLKLIYLLVNIIAITTLPTITGILTTILFCLYFALGWTILGDSNNVDTSFFLGEKENENQYAYLNEEEDTIDNVRMGTLPFASFVGAIASGALLSPQGLVMDSGSISLFPVASIIIMSIPLLALIGETKELSREELRLDMKQTRQLLVSEERKKMDLWDHDLKAKSVEMSEENDLA